MKRICTSLSVMVAASLLAATLDVELKVTHGIYTGGESVACRSVVYLVLDRSGSMGEKSLPDGRTPNEALLETLKMQLDAIQLGSEVHVIPFSSEIWDEVVYAKLDESGRKAIIDFVKDRKPKGQTVLYDAQDMALTAAAKVMEADENAEVRVLVYTDGLHQTPWIYKGEYRACCQKKAGGLGRKKFVDNPAYEEELAAAKKKFEDKFSNLVAKPNLEVEYEWLSASPKPEEGIHTKTVIVAELASHTPELLNPLENPKQEFKGGLHVPISDKLWEDVKGKPIKIEWTVGGKTATAGIKLVDGRQTCSVEWPSLPEDASKPAMLSVKGMPEGRKFILKDPKPVAYTIPMLRRAEVSIVTPAEGAVVVVGDKVKFEAKTTENNVAWKFPDSLAEGLTCEKMFDKEGPVKYSVAAAKGARATTVERTILVSAKPEIKIVEPKEYDGDPESASLRAGDTVNLKASVKGVLTSTMWVFEQDEKVVSKIRVAVKDGVAASSYKLPKEGLYDITVTAEGPAGKVSEYVQIYAKPKKK